MKGVVKLGIAAVVVAAAAGLLVVAAEGARERGRVSYCRNNLRKLGEMAHQKLGSEPEVAATGRAFWQEVRVENFTNVRGGKETWVIRFGGLNPFGCPVRGRQPLDLSALSDEDLARHMSDPATIDYRGPRQAPGASSGRPVALGADLDGNHPGGGGHVLFADLSMRDVREAVHVKDGRETTGWSGDVTE